MHIAALAVLAVPVGLALARIAAWVPDLGGGGYGRPSRRMRTAIVIVSALAFSIVGAVVGSEWTLVPILIVTSALITLSAVDIDRYRLPNRLLFPSIAVAFVTIVVVSISTGNADHIVPSVVGGVVYFGLLFVPSVISPAGLAFGDVKLALLLGLTIGWTRSSIPHALSLVINALLLGMILGIVSGVLVGLGRRVFGPDFLADPDEPEPIEGEEPARPSMWRTAFPFGPALALSAMVITLANSSLVTGPSLF
ncbi:MAG: prepilin peptidase [Acidimicrobiales bacterium]